MEFHKIIRSRRIALKMTQQKLAQKLSANFPHIRVDFYEIKGRVYFGEMTFYHNSGLSHIYPLKWERDLGEWIKLS